jgi:ubiquinone/menaquinone biosynthesis C-methylase UbiE
MGCRVAGVDIDPEMFRPSHLHEEVIVADVYHLPFIAHSFDLITATNLLFLIPFPAQVLYELKRFLHPSGKIAMLNPSENLTEQGAMAFAEKRGLEALARDTLVNWARRAEANYRWTEDETRELYASAGMKYMASEIKIGPGFGRFSWATT